MSAPSVGPALTALALAPLLLGVVNRTKAMMAGRVGQPLLQPYHDVVKLMRKGAVYSRTTTWVFRAGPVVGLAAMVVAIALVPFGGVRALVAFRWNRRRAAKQLGVSYKTLLNKMKECGISAPNE